MKTLMGASNTPKFFDLKSGYKKFIAILLCYLCMQLIRTQPTTEPQAGRTK